MLRFSFYNVSAKYVAIYYSLSSFHFPMASMSLESFISISIEFNFYMKIIHSNAALILDVRARFLHFSQSNNERFSIFCDFPFHPANFQNIHKIKIRILILSSLKMFEIFDLILVEYLFK